MTLVRTTRSSSQRRAGCVAAEEGRADQDADGLPWRHERYRNLKKINRIAMDGNGSS
jgi:hypothetical protein